MIKPRDDRPVLFVSLLCQAAAVLLLGAIIWGLEAML